MNKEEKIYIVGHKNPDTDSICSAISYAYLKNKTSGTNKYHARRAGQINEETEFVLKYWGIDAPKYLPNVGLQVRDMEIKEIEGAPDDITIRIAWEFMQESETTTLPVVAEDGQLKGLLTVGDITNYFIDVYSRTVMSEAGTRYYDIAETINGIVVSGNDYAIFNRGKVVVATSRPEDLAGEIEDDDLVILGDREDTQQAAIRAGASCIVITGEMSAPKATMELADSRNCVVICTRFDTYTTARLINQSIPAKSLMRKPEELVSFHPDDFVDDIRETMGKLRFRSFPVLDRSGRFLGMIERRSLLTAKRKQVILVDHTEKSQAVDNLEQAEILEIVDHHRIGTVETLQPVFFRGEPVGCTATILTTMFRERGMDIPKEIAGLLCSAILSDTLMFRSPTCTPRDVGAANELAVIAGINITEYAKQMFRAGSNLKGKTPDEILHQDYKRFTFGETTFGVGQISSMDLEELKEIKTVLRPALEEECGKRGVSMVFFMLTDITTEDTILMCCGEGSDELVKESFGADVVDGDAFLPKVVSRKKQLIPAFMQSLQK